jgi:predicted translin family RNA/ssDNA-binding protein
MTISVAGRRPAYVLTAQTLQTRQDAKSLTAARALDTARDASRSLTSGRFKASEHAKQQARAKVEELAKRVNILKKMFAANPREMARALAQVFKELKAAVKAYKAATGDELKLTGEVAGAAAGAPAPTTAPAVSEAGKDSAAQEDGQGNGEGDGAELATTEGPPAAPPPGAEAYKAVVGEMRKMIGEDGLEFIKLVRDFTNKLKELLEAARGQAAVKPKSKETDEQFEEADKALKDLKEDMEDMERDIRQAVPDAGMKLSVAA